MICLGDLYRIGQHAALADAVELVQVAYEKQVHSRRNRVDQCSTHLQVLHACLVDDDQAALQWGKRIQRVAFAVGPQQRVYGSGHGAELVHPARKHLGRLACGGGEVGLRSEQRRNRFHHQGLAAAWTGGQRMQPSRAGHQTDHCGALAWVEGHTHRLFHLSQTALQFIALSCPKRL